MHSIIVVIFRPYHAFANGKWRFSVWVNMSFLTHLTWIVRCDSDRMERSRGVQLSCEGTGA